MAPACAQRAGAMYGNKSILIAPPVCTSTCLRCCCFMSSTSKALTPVWDQGRLLSAPTWSRSRDRLLDNVHAWPLAETPGQYTKTFSHTYAYETSPCSRQAHCGALTRITCNNLQYTHKGHKAQHAPPPSCPITLSHIPIHAPTPPHLIPTLDLSLCKLCLNRSA